MVGTKDLFLAATRAAEAQAYDPGHYCSIEPSSTVPTTCIVLYTPLKNQISTPVTSLHKGLWYFKHARVKIRKKYKSCKGQCLVLRVVSWPLCLRLIESGKCRAREHNRHSNFQSGALSMMSTRMCKPTLLDLPVEILSEVLGNLDHLNILRCSSVRTGHPSTAQIPRVPHSL